jgi:UDP-glucose 4-epimerase
MTRSLTVQPGTAAAGTTRPWFESRVLVTGATGFIGSYLARRLTWLGAEVHAVSRRRPSGKSHQTWHEVDLGDPEATTRLVRATCPDIVFHLASAVTGRRNVELVRPTLLSNLTSAVNLLTAVVGRETRVVLAGSVEEPQEAEPVPQSPYAVAKWAATGYARMFHGLWNVPVTVLRVAMVYGPGQPDTEKLVPYVTLSLLRGKQPELSSGRRLVDWVYVDDVVDAFLLAARSERASGQVIDIGSGVQTSIRDVVELVQRTVGGRARPRFGAIDDRPLDRSGLADTEAAADLLGWRATTSLEVGIKRTVAWYAGRL